MSPIKGLSEQRKLPRLGKIRLGIKKKSSRTGNEYPVATDYFVCLPEVQKVHGEKPKRLDVIIPVEDDEIWASQYYRQYSRSRGLVCKGDGVTCRRMVDLDTGDIAGRDTKEVTWHEGGECLGKECPDYKGKSCQEVLNLQFLLPKVPGLGVWQIDTGSVNSIMNINNCATMIRAMCGRVSWIPLTLTLEPTEVNNPDDGKKKTVYCMHLRYDQSTEALLIDSEKPRLQMILSAPADDEAPGDRLLTTHSQEKAEECVAKAENDTDELWPQPASTPEPDNKKAGFIDEDWLKESLKTLKDNGVKAGSESNLLSFMKTNYKVEAKTVLEAARILDKGAAAHFTKAVQDTMDMAK
jgi:hypothetical protein